MSTASTTETDTAPLELVEALAELRERHGLAVSYSTAWNAAAAGRIPAQRTRGKWFVRPGDLPLVAAALAGGRRAAALNKRSERPPAAA